MITKRGTLFGYAVIIFLLLAGFYAIAETVAVPSSFPNGASFTVNENEPLSAISKRLQEEHIINSSLLFRMWVSYINKDRHVQLGVYDFEKPYTLPQVIEKLVVKGPDHPLLQFTVPEGSTDDEVVALITGVLKNASVEKLDSLIKDLQGNGRLFPSTYYILPSTTETEIVKTMISTFEDTYEGHFVHETVPAILGSKENVIILASILEGEAKTPKDMKLVSGILQKRMALGLPLQVDVDKETYKKKGLPALPLDNPGVVALDAAFHPTVSPYLYYLTGKDGTMYYAKTFEEHKQNISKYLK